MNPSTERPGPSPVRFLNLLHVITRAGARRRIAAPGLLLLVTALAVSSAGGGLDASPLAGKRCDFNNDGFDDLAIGVPGENVGSIVNAGAVNVIYGSGAGLTAAGDQIWHQDRASIQGVAEAGDAFGTAVACGNFNLDQYDDLAIGVPGEDVGGVVDAGAVAIIFGSNAGLTAAGNQLWHQNSGSVANQANAGDRFGAALAAGDFDDDVADDLAIGVPGEDLTSSGNAGAVNVLFGGSTGLTDQGNQFWHQDSLQVPDTVAGDESFGAALAAGDFNDDGFDDLAVGIPGEDLAQAGGGTASDGGAVIVLRGSYSGLVGLRTQFWSQAGLVGEPEDGDAFGFALTAGDFNDDGFDDLAVGAPGEDVVDARSAGAVNVIYGGASWLTSSGNQIWHQDTAAVVGVAERGDAFGAALAAADLNGDGTDDLAIGVPGEDVGAVPDAGSVNVLVGSASGLSGSGSQLVHQDTDSIEGVAEAGDAFGSSLSVGNFNGDGPRDLVAGVPGEQVNGVASAGAVNVLYGAGWGPSGVGDQIWHQGVAGIEGELETRDRMAGQVVTSDGVYRLPYANGTSVFVSGDLFTHSPDLYEYDLVGTGDDDGQYTVVAAGSGVIMAIDDSNAEPTSSNNYVWIAHGNGEWTKYTHLETGSVTALGLEEGDLVFAGTVLGFEGDVGQASGEHVHFEVMVPDDPSNAITGSGFAIGQTRVPLICGIPGSIMYAGRTYTAGGC